jgi:hypothetical protein
MIGFFAMKDEPLAAADRKRRPRMEAVEKAWLEEVLRRVERVERGESTFVDQADAMARARQRIGGGSR